MEGGALVQSMAELASDGALYCLTPTELTVVTAILVCGRAALGELDRDM